MSENLPCRTRTMCQRGRANIPRHRKQCIWWLFPAFTVAKPVGEDKGIPYYMCVEYFTQLFIGWRCFSLAWPYLVTCVCPKWGHVDLQDSCRLDETIPGMKLMNLLISDSHKVLTQTNRAAILYIIITPYCV